MGPIESHEKKVFRKNPNMGLQAILMIIFWHFCIKSPFQVNDKERMGGILLIFETCSTFQTFQDLMLLILC